MAECDGSALINESAKTHTAVDARAAVFQRIPAGLSGQTRIFGTTGSRRVAAIDELGNAIAPGAIGAMRSTGAFDPGTKSEGPDCGLIPAHA
jgi:hypothetical protein